MIPLTYVVSDSFPPTLNADKRARADKHKDWTFFKQNKLAEKLLNCRPM